MMTPLRQRTIDYLNLKGYAESTQRSYLQHLQEFALFYNCCPSTLSEEHLLSYLSHLRAKGLSSSTISQAYSAIKILFVNILGRSWDSVRLPRPQKSKTLPIVLSVEQLENLFNLTKNVKHRTILMMTYCAGLRLSEVRQLHLKDILVSRKMVFVRQAKDAKDRYTILSDKMIVQLQLYLKTYRPYHWLFTGSNPTQPISCSSLQSIYKQAKKRAGIVQLGGIHQLRHCFATHMVEAGMGVHQVQKLLGHQSIRSTMVYLHLAKDDFSDFEHPLDGLA